MKYKIINKSMLDGSPIQHTVEYENDEEAKRENSKAKIWKKIQ